MIGQNVGATNRAGFVLFMLFLINTLSYADRVIVSVLLPPIQAEFGFSDGQAGLLTGLVFAVTYSMSGFLLARWVDRGNRRNLLSLAVGFWSFATAACGLATGFGQLLVARMAVGVGEGAGPSASHSLICDYFPPARRSGAIAAQMAGTSVGSLLGFAGAGYMGSVYGWRTAFLVMGVAGILLAIATRLCLREPLRGVLDPGSTPSPEGGWRTFRDQLSNNRTFIHLVLTFGGMAFCMIGFQQWGPTFYFRYHAESLRTIGALYGLANGVGALLGTLSGGMFGNMLVKRAPAFPLLICAAAILAAIPLAIGSLLVANIYLSLVLAFLTAFLVGFPTGPIYSGIYNHTPVRVRAMATATTMLSVAILGIGLGPTAVGVVSDLLAPRVGDQSLRFAMTAAGAMLLWPATQAWLAARSLKTAPPLAS